MTIKTFVNNVCTNVNSSNQFQSLARVQSRYMLVISVKIKKQDFSKLTNSLLLDIYFYQPYLVLTKPPYASLKIHNTAGDPE